MIDYNPSYMDQYPSRNIQAQYGQMEDFDQHAAIHQNFGADQGMEMEGEYEMPVMPREEKKRKRSRKVRKEKKEKQMEKTTPAMTGAAETSVEETTQPMEN